MCIALVLGWVSGDLVVTALYGQANGVYDHYFNTFLNPADAMRGFVVTVAEVASMVMAAAESLVDAEPKQQVALLLVAIADNP